MFKLALWAPLWASHGSCCTYQMLSIMHALKQGACLMRDQRESCSAQPPSAEWVGITTCIQTSAAPASYLACQSSLRKDARYISM